MKPKFFYIYILFSLKDKKLYIGFTEDLRSRFKKHIDGKVTSTKNRLPLKTNLISKFTILGVSIAASANASLTKAAASVFTSPSNVIVTKR